MTEFSEYIKKTREAKNMTLNQVALYAEISAAQLSRIENGKRGTPKPTTIEKLSRALKVDYNDLMRIAGYLESDKTDSSEQDETEFQAFANNPSLQKWYKELPNSKEEDLERLRAMWEILKSSEK